MTSPPSARADVPRPVWTPWRTVFAFGLVSLAADMVYEGMRAMAGPFLGSLGSLGSLGATAYGVFAAVLMWRSCNYLSLSLPDP